MRVSPRVPPCFTRRGETSCGDPFKVDPHAIESAFRRAGDLECHHPRPSPKRRPFDGPSASETAHPFARPPRHPGVNPRASSSELDREVHGEACDPPRPTVEDASDRLLPIPHYDDEHPDIDGSRPGRARSGEPRTFTMRGPRFGPHPRREPGIVLLARRPTSDLWCLLSPRPTHTAPWSRAPRTRPRSSSPAAREDGLLPRSGDTFRRQGPFAGLPRTSTLRAAARTSIVVRPRRFFHPELGLRSRPRASTKTLPRPTIA